MAVLASEVVGGLFNQTSSDKVVAYSITGTIGLILILKLILLFSIAISMCVNSCRLRTLNKKLTRMEASHAVAAAAKYC